MPLTLRPPKISTDKLHLDEFKGLNTFLDDVARALLGGLSLGENVVVNPVPCEFPVFDTEVAIQHGLGRIPRGYIVAKSNNGAVIYDSDRQPTAERIYLKATVSGAKVSLVFF